MSCKWGFTPGGEQNDGVCQEVSLWFMASSWVCPVLPAGMFDLVRALSR